MDYFNAIKEVASLPLHSVVGRINTEIGWEVISPPAYRELTKHGVVSLYLLRSLPEEKWNLLPFSDYKKSLIQNAIGKGETLTIEPLPALELMQNYRFDRPDPRIADISITCDALDDEDISKGLKLPPLLRREMDREAVYSAVSRYDEKVSYFPRPHAKAIIDDEEMKRKENILEQFPVNADTDEEIDRRQIGKEDNWAKWEELKNAAEEEREPNIPEDERKELVHKFFGWDRAENAKKQFEEKFGHLVNKPLVDDILTGITEENADFDKKKLAEKLKDEEFTSKIIKKDEKAEFGDKTDLEDSSEFRNLGKRSESNGNELSDDINLDDSDLIDFSPDVNDVPSKAKIKGFENSEFDSVDVQEEFTTFTDSDELSESHGISGSQDIDDMDNLQQEMAEETEEYDAENVVEGEEIKETTEEEKSITEETAEEDISITEITQKDFSGEKNVGRLMDQMDRETKLSDYSEETMVDGEGDVSYEMSEIDEMKIVAAHEKEDERKLRRWARRNKAKGEKSKEDEEKQKQFLKDIPRLQKAMKGKMDLEEKRIDFPLDEENLLRGKMMDAKNKKAVRNLDGVADMHEILQALKFDRFDMMEKMEEMQRKHNIMKDSVEYEKFAEKTFIDKADDEPWRLDDKRIGRSRELECAADPGSPVIWNVKSDGTSEEDYLEDTQ